MSPTFTINFRREAYRQELARARRRLAALAIWVGYFGVVAMTVGLYALNCATVTKRVQRIERQAVRLKASRAIPESPTVGAPEMAQAERALAGTRRWRDRLVRLPALLPPDAVVTGLEANPENTDGTGDIQRLVLTGEMRTRAGQDRMAAVMQFVAALQQDPVFARGYQSVKLVHSSLSPGPDPVTVFTVECR